MVADHRFDLDLLDEQDPFEIDAQAAHLFKHPHLGVEDVEDVWASDPLFYPAKPPAHWLMCAGVRPGVGGATGALTSRRSTSLPPDRLLRGHPRTCYPVSEGPLSKKPLTPEQEYEYYAQPDNQQPQGPPQRRQPRLSAIVPVRFPPELLDEIRRRAEADDRSLSSWIRRAVEHELGHSA